MKVSLLASALSLAALIATIYVRRDHTAIVMSFLGQAVGLVVGSQLLAELPYRLRFRSKQFVDAFHFAYPLMFNGVGLAVSAQGDRFLVGALLGLPALGFYSIVVLVTIVPVSMVFRIMGTMNMAAFHNALAAGELLTKRILFAARLSPFVATVYSLGILTLMNVVTPAVFGAKFTVSRMQLCLLALGAFFRIIRVEPSTSLLLYGRRTKRVAAGSLSTILGYAIAIPFIEASRTIDAAFAARLLGEVVGLFTMVIVARPFLAGQLSEATLSAALGLLIVGGACGEVWWSMGLNLLSGVIGLG